MLESENEISEELVKFGLRVREATQVMQAQIFAAFTGDARESSMTGVQIEQLPVRRISLTGGICGKAPPYVSIISSHVKEVLLSASLLYIKGCNWRLLLTLLGCVISHALVM